MKTAKTYEPQYQVCLDRKKELGLSTFGLMSNQVWQDDPRRLVFLLARYKFVSKLLSGSNHVLEVGCADAFGTRIVRQEVKQLTAVDIDPVFIHDATMHASTRWPVACRVHNMLSGPVAGGPFDAVYSLDVLEHIRKRDERAFIANICKSMSKHSVLILGSPTIQSQQYASPPSKEGHINCKDHHELKKLMTAYFNNVFLFSMNDEVVHTGFYPMAHYLFAVCCAPKDIHHATPRKKTGSHAHARRGRK